MKNYLYICLQGRDRGGLGSEASVRYCHARPSTPRMVAAPASWQAE